jgi:hypothetical protein
MVIVANPSRTPGFKWRGADGGDVMVNMEMWMTCEAVVEFYVCPALSIA